MQHNKLFFFLFFVFYISVFLSGQIIPRYSINVCDSSSTGYYVFAAIKPGQKIAKYPAYHFILDKKGAVVYFKKFPLDISPGDFKLHRNGMFSYYYKNKFLIMDSTFTIVDSVCIKNGFKEDGHDLQILANGHYVLLGIEEKKVDVSTQGHFLKKNVKGSKAATVRYGIVQEQDKNKTVIFEWHSSNHYDISHIDSLYLNDTTKINIPHINSVEMDVDSNYIISCRNFNEITKINRKTGSIIWRLGGKQNAFQFTNDTNKFYAQHAVRLISKGHLSLYDNGYENPLHPSSAKEYEIDENSLKAKLIWSFTNNPKSFSTGIGNVKRLQNGSTLINYGLSFNDNTMFNVVSKEGKKIFEITFSDTLRAYRAFNYLQLPWKIKQPKVVCVKIKGQWYLEAEGGYKEYLWSDGTMGRRMAIKNNGRYFVSVPYGEGGNVCSLTYEIVNVKKPFNAFEKKVN